MSRSSSPVPQPSQTVQPAGPATAARLSAVPAAIARVRRRLRLQRALQHGVDGLLLGLALAWFSTLSYRLGAVSQSGLQRLFVLGGGLALAGAVLGALRRIDLLDVAARIDQSHALCDRMASALQFTGVGSTAPPSPFGPEAALRELAIADAERVAVGVEPGRAAPFVRPHRLSWIGLLLMATLLSLFVRLPRPATPTLPPPPEKAAAEARLIVDAELIAPEKDELRRLLAEAEGRGDEEAAAILRELQKLLEQVERGELTRKEAFDKLAELEQRLLQGKNGALEELKEKLRKAGNELSEAKLTKELGQALAKEDLAKAQAELKKLASEARVQGEKDRSDRQAMAQAFERAAKGLHQGGKTNPTPPLDATDKARAEERARRMQELKAEEQRLKKQLEQNPQDQEAKARLEQVQRELQQLRDQAQRELEQASKKDEWQSKTQAEEQTKRAQELQDEERRLKKKLEENPQDEESERRLKKVQRELEQLERQKQEREQARRELEQLERDMQRAAEEMQKQLDRMTPEQRKALEKMMEDMQRMQEQLRRMGQGQGQNQRQQQGQGQQGQGQQGQGRGPVTIALGSIKQVLRRVGRSSQGQQGQGQQGQGQNQGQGQQGQGQNQGQGMSGSMKDFMNRASGKGQGQGQGKDGEGDVLVEGDGQGKDGQGMILLGQGNDPVIIPGLGMGPQGQGQGQGPGSTSMQPGGERPGTQHDPNLTGDVTQLDSKRRLTRVYGKEGAGPTRSETILGAAEKGFASQPYRKVYGDYTAVSERAMTQQRVPPGYRFYVKRYFQMIKPRE